MISGSPRVLMPDSMARSAPTSRACKVNIWAMSMRLLKSLVAIFPSWMSVSQGLFVLSIMILLLARLRWLRLALRSFIISFHSSSRSWLVRFFLSTLEMFCKFCILSVAISMEVGFISLMVISLGRFTWKLLAKEIANASRSMFFLTDSRVLLLDWVRIFRFCHSCIKVPDIWLSWSEIFTSTCLLFVSSSW